MDEPLPVRGGDKSAPEHQSEKRCNPFRTRYILYRKLSAPWVHGNTPSFLGMYLRDRSHSSYQRCYGFEFMEDSVNLMTFDNPTKRPRIEEMLEMFVLIRASLSQSKLRSPIMSRKVPKFLRVVQQEMQSLRTMQYVLSRHSESAIPNPDYPRISRAATLWTTHLLLYFLRKWYIITSTSIYSFYLYRISFEPIRHLGNLYIYCITSTFS